MRTQASRVHWFVSPLLALATVIGAIPSARADIGFEWETQHTTWRYDPSIHDCLGRSDKQQCKLTRMKRQDPLIHGPGRAAFEADDTWVSDAVQAAYWRSLWQDRIAAQKTGLELVLPRSPIELHEGSHGGFPLTPTGKGMLKSHLDNITAVMELIAKRAPKTYLSSEEIANQLPALGLKAEPGTAIKVAPDDKGTMQMTIGIPLRCIPTVWAEAVPQLKNYTADYSTKAKSALAEELKHSQAKFSQEIIDSITGLVFLAAYYVRLLEHPKPSPLYDKDDKKLDEDDHDLLIKNYLPLLARNRFNAMLALLPRDALTWLGEVDKTGETRWTILVLKTASLNHGDSRRALVAITKMHGNARTTLISLTRKEWLDGLIKDRKDYLIERQLKLPVFLPDNSSIEINPWESFGGYRDDQMDTYDVPGLAITKAPLFEIRGMGKMDLEGFKAEALHWFDYAQAMFAHEDCVVR
jgi:hypothetical protein